MKTHKLNTSDELILLFDQYKHSSQFKYRGQSNKNWELIPKAGRSNFRKVDDQEIFRHWKRRAKYLLSYENLNEIELLNIAQHYGLTTRLLDWSLNPLVACYFACFENENLDGAVFICKSESSLVPEIIKNPFALEGISFIQPNGSSLRINNQYGYFTIHNPSFKKVSNEEFELEKFIIPHNMKKDLILRLNQFGINNVSLFPDLEGITKHLNWFFENFPKRY